MRFLSRKSLLAVASMLALCASTVIPSESTEAVQELDLSANCKGLDACFLLLEVETGKAERVTQANAHAERESTPVAKLVLSHVDDWDGEGSGCRPKKPPNQSWPSKPPATPSQSRRHR